MNELGVTRWLTCKNAVEFSSNGIDPDFGYPPIPGQLFSNFACDNLIVVVNSSRVEEFPDASHIRGPKITLATVFHNAGRLEDLSVRTALISACGNCPFFISKT